MAAYGGYKVISIDYRMPPDFPYPAAMAVWREAIKMQLPAGWRSSAPRPAAA
jgi:acetyl esterase/lipase